MENRLHFCDLRMPDPMAGSPDDKGKGAGRPSLDAELRDLWPRCMRQLLRPCRMALPPSTKGGQPRAFIRGVEVEASEFSFEQGGWLGTDGSASEAKWPELARAGWVAVQVLDNLEELVIYGPVSEDLP